MAGIRGAASAIRQFAGPRTIDELLRLERAAEQLRASGAATDEVERAIAAAQGMFSPEDIRIGRLLKALEQEATFPSSPMRPMTLNALDVPPIPGRLDDMDGPTLQAINKANNSFQGLQSGRTLNLRNQNTPLNQVRRDDILTAAQDAIRGQQEAIAAENLGRAAATAGVGGLAAMIAESTGRMNPSPAGIGDLESVAEAPELRPAPRRVPEDIVLPDVPIDLPEAMDPPDMYAVKNIARDLPLEQIDLLNDDPMATADLVEESRPIPASTPRVAVQPSRPETLTPAEIEALRSQVVSIRDAQTGEAMDSFYPPESEEYKAEQRMKKMYPQLRRR